jgi:hypothetical protein
MGELSVIDSPFHFAVVEYRETVFQRQHSICDAIFLQVREALFEDRITRVTLVR